MPIEYIDNIHIIHIHNTYTVKIFGNEAHRGKASGHAKGSDLGQVGSDRLAGQNGDQDAPDHNGNGE